MRNFARAAAAALALSLIAFIPIMPAAATAVGAAQDALPHNYTGVWWKSTESGWGVNFAHQNNVVFATWFTFAADGTPQWFTVVASKTADLVYAGNVGSFTGLPFNTDPYAANANVKTTRGTATITFAADGQSATFDYTVDGIHQTKAITPQQFVPSVALPTCAYGTTVAGLSAATNYQGLWWATHGTATGGEESGYGINFNHQGKVIFATWFTYDTNGKGWWLFSVATETSPKVYTGTVRTATGPAFSAEPWDPSAVVRTTVGNVTITINDGNHAKFDYTVNGVAQTKNLVRQVFDGLTGTACSYPDNSAAFVTQLTDLAGKANRGEITDDQYVTQLAALLATIDGTPGAVDNLEAYLEASIVGHAIAFDAGAAGKIATKAVSGDLLAAIKASFAYKLLQAAAAAVTFSPTPGPSGSFLQVTDPALMVLLNSIPVRTQILDAELAGTITGAKADELLGLTAGNPYDTLRRLYILQGIAIPGWLLPAPNTCVVNCGAHTYAGPVNETAQLSFTIPAVPPFPATNCVQTVNFTGNVSMILTVHPDNTVDGSATATGTFKSLTTNNPILCPLQTIPVNETITITGTIDHFTAVINIGNGLFPGTLVGQLINDNTVSGQIQVANKFDGNTVVLNFTLTRI